LILFQEQSCMNVCSRLALRVNSNWPKMSKKEDHVQ
jgi:hypothetical protein